MVTVGDGLGEALSILYMYKRLGVQDLMTFSEKFSVPGILGRTSAQKGTPEADAMRDSVLNYASDWVGVVYGDDGGLKSPIELMQTTSSGALPQMTIMEYMDRGIATLVRGGDLSTISRADGTGSNPQADETEALLQDDCAMVSETLQTQIDRLVIRMVHGDDKPAAYIVISPPSDEDLVRELTIDEGLQGLGVKQDAQDLAERYGRELATPESADISANERRVTGPPPPAIVVSQLVKDGYADIAAMLERALQADGKERARLLRETAALVPEKIVNPALDDALTELLTRALLGDDEPKPDPKS
jgi:hypothetical protein